MELTVCDKNRLASPITDLMRISYGLDLHSRGCIHADLKPENIMFNIPTERIIQWIAVSNVRRGMLCLVVRTPN